MGCLQASIIIKPPNLSISTSNVRKNDLWPLRRCVEPFWQERAMYNTQRPQPLVVLLDKRNWSVTLPRSTVELCLFFFFSFWPCYVAFGILVPHLGIDPRPSAVEAWNPNHWSSREVCGGLCFNNSKCSHKTCCVSGTLVSILQRLIHLIFISLWDKYYYNPYFTYTKNMTWKY